jgi:hypothetical protein
MMKLEEFGKWLATWVRERESTIIPQVEQPERIILVPDAPYNLYDDKEWLTISWGLIR